MMDQPTLRAIAHEQHRRRQSRASGSPVRNRVLIFSLSWPSPLKVEVDAEEYAAAPHAVGREERRSACAIAAFRDDADRFGARVLPIESDAGAAEHDGVPPIAHGVGSDVSEAAGITGVRLLTDVNFFETPQDYVLGIQIVVRFEKSAVKRGGMEIGRQRTVLRTDGVAEVGAVMAVHEERQELEIVNVEVTGKTDAVERFVAHTDELLWSAVRNASGLIVCRALADVGEGSDAFESKALGVKGLAESKVHVVGATGRRPAGNHVIGKSDAALVAAQYRY